MRLAGPEFYKTDGTLPHNAPSYVERRADDELQRALRNGEFCYVLTSRQMGKSSLVARTATRLAAQGIHCAALDLQRCGQNLTPEQWYGGLLLTLGERLDLNDALEESFLASDRLSPVQRFMAAIRNVALAKLSGPLVIFVDEIDMVRSLPFPTDEFFSAMKDCYNRRVEDATFGRLTFCLLGVATPSELIRNPRTTPFNMGRRIELTDFTPTEAEPLAAHLDSDPALAHELLIRVFHWTNGHPYLTQLLCRALCEEKASLDPACTGTSACVDRLCERLFLSRRAKEQDSNLLFVRTRILRTEADLSKLLGLYEQVRREVTVADDESNDLIKQLLLSGIVAVREGRLRVRNRIYHQVFDEQWVASSRPDAELELPDGQRRRIDGSCSIGRVSAQDISLPDVKVSRRHALIQVQHQHEFWLMDLGSSNGTFVNGRRVTQPVLLRNEDQIEVGPFRLIFRQARAPAPGLGDRATSDQTLRLSLSLIPP